MKTFRILDALVQLILLALFLHGLLWVGGRSFLPWFGLLWMVQVISQAAGLIAHAQASPFRWYYLLGLIWNFIILPAALLFCLITLVMILGIVLLPLVGFAATCVSLAHIALVLTDGFTWGQRHARTDNHSKHQHFLI